MENVAAYRSARATFPLLELLESMPGVFQDHLLPALQVCHKAALAATCTKTRAVVQRAARSLQLHAGKCCLVHTDDLAPKLPNITDLSLKPGNLHEAMYVLPSFFMKDACRMSGISSLQLLDQLPDRPPDRIQCGSCLAFTSTYDLSAILVTAHTSMPNLVALDFSTHYISDAECAAIAMMTGLTRLRLRSTHGTKSGGLSRLTTLCKLSHMCLLDSNLDRFAHPGDIAMLLSRSCLTSLEIRYHPVLVPAMLSALVEIQQLADEALAASSDNIVVSSPAGPMSPAHNHSVHQTRVPPAASSPSDPKHTPPPLRSLSIVLSPYMRTAAESVSLAAKLTNLTRLSLGWYVRTGFLEAEQAVDEVIPPAIQQQLSQLVQLRELALGWVVDYDLLSTLAMLSGLTHLHLGRLPYSKPPEGLQLSYVNKVTLHLRSAGMYDDVSGWVAPQHQQMIAGLAAFPKLDSLELTGDISAYTLAHLPTVIPASLRQLQLPQRMASAGFENLASLRRVTGLTNLRVGWRATLHDGPPTLSHKDNHLASLNLIAAAAAVSEVASAVANSSSNGQIKQHEAISLAALTCLQRMQTPVPASAAVGMINTPGTAADLALQQGATAQVHESQVQIQADRVGVQPSAMQGPWQAAAAGAEAAGSSTAAAVAAQQHIQGSSVCSFCGSPLTLGCLCRLQQLELVGPATADELMHLTGLHSLQTLVLRDNCTWSSGLPVHNLARVVSRCSKLRRLEIIGCPGVDAIALERSLRALDQDKLMSLDVAVTQGGKTAAELGMGYQFIGDVFSPAQERGDEETTWWGGAQAEDDAAAAEHVYGPQPVGQAAFVQLQETLMHLQQLLGQLHQLNAMHAMNQDIIQQLQHQNQQHQLQQAVGQQQQHAAPLMNQQMQVVTVQLQHALQHHNNIMQAIAQQVQQLQLAEYVHQHLQAIGAQLQQAANAGELMQPHLLALGAQLQQVGHVVNAVAALDNGGGANQHGGGGVAAVEDGAPPLALDEGDGVAE